MSAIALLILLQAGSGQATEDGTPPTIDRSRPVFSDEDYPREALKARAEGRVVMTLQVSPRGKVTACTVTTGSGSEALDAASCRFARALPITPARDAAGRKIAGSLEHRMNWRLPR